MLSIHHNVTMNICWLRYNPFDKGMASDYLQQQKRKAIKKPIIKQTADMKQVNRIGKLLCKVLKRKMEEFTEPTSSSDIHSTFLMLKAAVEISLVCGQRTCCACGQCVH